MVADAEDIIVNFADGTWTRGEVVATDPQADLAVIQITAPDGITLRPLTLADPAAVGVGNWVRPLAPPLASITR